MQRTEHRIYSFDKFGLNVTRGCLLSGVDEIKLRPKSFEVLKYLTENSGRLVTKDEIISAVWHDTAVTDDSLVQCMKDIRHALNDDSQHIIRTVPRRGYIFDTEVSENGPTTYTEETSGVQILIEQQVPIQAGPDDRQRSLPGRFLRAAKRHRVATVCLLVIITIVVAGAAVFNKPIMAWWFKPPSIAVLPIINGSGDAELDYLADGFTESIIMSLAQLNERGKPPRLRITAQNTMFIFKGKDIEPRSVGVSLGVDSILTSRMTTKDGLKTFKFELINVSDGSIGWTKQYGAHTYGELLDLQDDIPRDIAAQLPLKLRPSDLQTLTRRYTQSPDAFDAYLKGRSATHMLTPSGLAKSLKYFQQAIDIDPNFALAYWAMGFSYYAQGSINALPDKEANSKAADLYQKALKIDNNLTVATAMLRSLDANQWNWEAIANAGPTHPAYNTYLIAIGHVDEVVELESRRLLRDPYHPVQNFTHCGTLVLARRFDEAIAQCEKTLNLVPVPDRPYFGPESPWIHQFMAAAYVNKGMFAEAIANAEMARSLGEDSMATVAALGTIYAKAGQRSKAIELEGLLRQRMNAGEYASPLNMAFLNANLGDNDEAFKWIDRAFDEQENRLTNIKVSWNFDPLRSDPRFNEVVSRLGLPN